MKYFNIPSDWVSQWHKPMLSFFDYVPTKYEATAREKQIRSLIWDFKAGKRTKQVAKIVADKISEKFGSFSENIVFACIPASSADRTETRYHDFCEEVSRLCGCVNGYMPSMWTAAVWQFTKQTKVNLLRIRKLLRLMLISLTALVSLFLMTS